MLKNHCAVFIVLFTLNHIQLNFAQGVPSSPCPKMFQYRFDGMEWFGMLSVRDPDHGQPLHLRVTLSLRGKPTTDYLGEIEMLTRGQFLSSEPVLYKVKFPKTHFSPKLLQITINGQIVCLGIAEQSIFVTQIQLEHTRKFTFISDDSASPLAPGFAPTSDTAQFLTSNAAANSQAPQPTNLAFGNRHLQPLRKFDTPMRATKDVCGTIDNRIRFQGLHHATKNGKSAARKFRSSAGVGDVNFRKEKKDTVKDVDYQSDVDEGDDINNSGANIPLVTADFSDPSNSDDLPGMGPVSTTSSTSTSTMTTSDDSELPSITRGAWPWLAAIYVNNLTSLAYQCGGTLISTRVVISSAHCFKLFKKNYTANEVLVFLGRHNLKNWNEEGSIAAPVDDIFIHPDFDSHLNTYDADIAVLVLKNEVRFNAFIRPACLWSGASNTEFIEGENGIVVGWGLSSLSRSQQTMTASSTTQSSLSKSNMVPRVINAPIVSNQVCFQADAKYHSLSSNRTFCAGVVAQNVPTPLKSKLFKFKTKMRVSQSGPCTGDSGSGLMIFKNQRWILRGTVSASLPTNDNDNDGATKTSTTENSKRFKCNVNQYVIYTDVAKFLDWIFAFII